LSPLDVAISGKTVYVVMEMGWRNDAVVVGGRKYSATHLT